MKTSKKIWIGLVVVWIVVIVSYQINLVAHFWKRPFGRADLVRYQLSRLVVTNACGDRIEVNEIPLIDRFEDLVMKGEIHENNELSLPHCVFDFVIETSEERLISAKLIQDETMKLYLIFEDERLIDGDSILFFCKSIDKANCLQK